MNMETESSRDPREPGDDSERERGGATTATTEAEGADGTEQAPAPESDSESGSPAAQFESVEGSRPSEDVDPEKTIGLLQDVSLRVRVELGRGQMFLRDILRLTQGSVVELDKPSGDPLDIYVNGRLVARGEVLVVNDSFSVRVTEILSPEECFRIKDE